ncbi:MAG TPA: DnaJ family domain-containing protein [Steroidobacteraceae bacterium]|nr:DnaJ family domain-containing protein [Steroidobacteraceae bacterium]
MLIFSELVERRIREAIAKGEFEDLPGTGRPVPLEDASLVPEELRVAYRVLRNSGHLPPELELRREIGDAEALLIQAIGAEQRGSAVQKLNLLRLRLAGLHGGRTNAALERDYLERLLTRLCGG